MMRQGFTNGYFSEVTRLLNTMVVTSCRSSYSAEEGVQRAAAMLVEAASRGGRALVLGNGGSAAIAAHMECDLCNAASLPAVAFQTGPSLTALANDYGYDHAFERQVNLWAQPVDVVIAVSSSGMSPNIIHAVETAETKGCSIITLTGFAPDNTLRMKGDLNFYVASSEYGKVESAHAVIGHCITDLTARMVGAKRQAHSVQ